MDEVIAQCYVSLARLVKDKKYELIQINNNDSDNTETDPMLYYLKKSAEMYEVLCSSEHPMTAEAYSKVALWYQDRSMLKECTDWMRKAYCVFYSTCGVDEKITEESFTFLAKLENNLGTKFKRKNMHQLADALITAFEYGEIGQEENFEDDDDYNYDVNEDYIYYDSIGNKPSQIMIEYN